jgi:hypothetical protein
VKFYDCRIPGTLVSIVPNAVSDAEGDSQQPNAISIIPNDEPIVQVY